MPLKILIAPDKFKGTLTASEASRAIAVGWRSVRPDDELTSLPISDGGDGFGDLLAGALEMTSRAVGTTDAAGRPRQAVWWSDTQNQRAVVESAEAIGMVLLPKGEFHPFDLDTRGVGTLLKTVAATGVGECLVGIGGSATNDGGFGMACVLGWRFEGPDGRELERWTELDRLETIDPPVTPLALKVTVASDVRNPLLGSAGASRVYGPQKGLRPGDFAQAEACLGRLAEVVARNFKRNPATVAGGGAAGGLGFGLVAFADAKIKSGFEIFAEVVDLEEKVRNANLVITGEGAIDRSTLMGKGAGQVAALGLRHGLPCIGLAGTVVVGALELGDCENGFSHLYGIVPEMANSEEAMADPEKWLRRLAAKAAREWDGRRGCAPHRCGG